MVPLYTACFSLGSAGSYAVSAAVAETAGWRAAFGLAAGAAALAVVLVLMLRPLAPEANPSPSRLLDFRPVLRNRPAMGYILGYAVHMWELFAFRSWVVAFLAFAATMPGAAAHAEGLLAPNAVATLGALVAFGSSLAGAEVATRLGRGRLVMLYMLISAATAFLVGPAAAVSYPVAAAVMLLYAGVIQLDSAALTTGAVEHAENSRRGATLAVHSLIGFLAAFVGPLVVGMVLDAAQDGAQGAEGWTWAFASVGLVGLLGPVAMIWGLRGRGDDTSASAGGAGGGSDRASI